MQIAMLIMILPCWTMDFDELFLESYASEIRQSRFDDQEKGHLLLCLVENGMTKAQVKQIFGSSKDLFVCCIGYYPCCDFYYTNYGVHISFDEHGRVCAKRERVP